MLFGITFHGREENAVLTTYLVSDVRAVVESGASVTVRWGKFDWGDACDGEAKTETLHNLLYEEEGG